MYNGAFSRLHPLTEAVYFILLLASGAFTMHPCFIVLSLLGAVGFAVCISGKKVLRKGVYLLIPILTAAAVNVLFNHRGRVILVRFPSGNALTLESLLYGAAAGVSISAVLIWCYCFYKTFTPDKLISLTGRSLPSLSLVLSMSFRFIPLFVRRFKEISDSQHQLGRGIRDGNIVRRLSNLARIFSILISRALEGSVITADSMKSRGYGLERRSTYDIFRFRFADAVFIVLSVLCAGSAIAGLVMGFAEFRFYPMIYMSELDIKALTEFAGFGLLCFMPMIYELTEGAKWRSQMSKL